MNIFLRCMAWGLVGLGITAAALAAGPPSYGPVGQETLWTIAGKVNGQQHLGTTAQVAWALFRGNPQAFEGTPGKIKPGATLTIPDVGAVTSVSAAEAYEKVTGLPATAAKAPATAMAPRTPKQAKAPTVAAESGTAPSQPQSAPAPSTPAPIVHAATPHAVPVVLGVELQRTASGKQWLGVVGSNFRPGAVIDLADLINGTRVSAQRPRKIVDDRIDVLAPVGNSVSNWLITVRNADGTQSEGYGFAAGPGAASAAAPIAAPAPPDAAALAAAKAAADKAALDREFEEKMAADRAAYEKTEAGRIKKAGKARRRR